VAGKLRGGTTDSAINVLRGVERGKPKACCPVGLLRRLCTSANFHCGDLSHELRIEADSSRLHGRRGEDESLRGSSEAALHHAEGSNRDAEVVRRTSRRSVSPSVDENRFIRSLQMLINRRDKHVRDTTETSICRETVAQRILGQPDINVIATEPFPRVDIDFGTGVIEKLRLDGARHERERHHLPKVIIASGGNRLKPVLPRRFDGL